MFDNHRAEALVAEITRLGETMATIAEEQRVGILAHPDNHLARLDEVVTGVMRTQTELVAVITVLSTTVVDFLLDQERERDLGLRE